MPWTIDLLIDRWPYSRITELSITRNWNCPGSWKRRPSSNWISPDIWFWRLLLNSWICSNNWLRRLKLSSNWNCVTSWCLVLSNNWNYPDKRFRSLLIGIVLTIDFGCCPWIGIVRTTYIDCLVMGIIRTSDFGNGPLIGIVRTTEFYE